MHDPICHCRSPLGLMMLLLDMLTPQPSCPTVTRPGAGCVCPPNNVLSDTDVALSTIAGDGATRRVRYGPCPLVPLPPHDTRQCLRKRHDYGSHPDVVLIIA